MPLFRKKPVVIEARQLSDESWIDIAQWLGKSYIRSSSETERLLRPSEYVMWVRTLEGPIMAQSGDWIIKGVKEEFYPCKPDIFEATYEEAFPTEKPLSADYADSAE